MSCPEHLQYTKNHEWISLVNANEAIVGITEHAQCELGDIVYVTIDSVGKSLQADQVFGAVEAVKAASDLFIPVTGTVTEKNAMLETDPSLVNKDPYGKGWMVKVRIDNHQELAKLLDASAYQALIATKS